jgi:hypothetical protein
MPGENEEQTEQVSPAGDCRETFPIVEINIRIPFCVYFSVYGLACIQEVVLKVFHLCVRSVRNCTWSVGCRKP